MSDEVSQTSGKAYVYEIIVDGVVRYVGKGRGRRMKEHRRIAMACSSRKPTPFYERLAKAISLGSEVTERIVQGGLSDEAAFALEILEIAKHPAEQTWNVRKGGGSDTPDVVRKKISHSIREHYEHHPEARKAMGDIVKKRLSQPEEREKIASSVRRKWSDPDARRRQVDAMRTPEARTKRSLASKAAWDDPEVRARRIAAQKAYHSTEEASRRKSEAMKKRWQQQRPQ